MSGDDRVGSTSSSHAKAARPATAGQWPRRSGYGNGLETYPLGSQAASHPAPRPTARHGLNSEKTSPSTSVTGTSATQKTT